MSGFDGQYVTDRALFGEAVAERNRRKRLIPSDPAALADRFTSARKVHDLGLLVGTAVAYRPAETCKALSLAFTKLNQGKRQTALDLAWSLYPGRPEPVLGAREWVRLFRQARFDLPLQDDVDPVRLFRASVPEDTDAVEGRGLAWTPEKWAAEMYLGARGGRLHTTTAPEGAILWVRKSFLKSGRRKPGSEVQPLRTGDPGVRDYHEMVIDPLGLRIKHF